MYSWGAQVGRVLLHPSPALWVSHTVGTESQIKHVFGLIQQYSFYILKCDFLHLSCFCSFSVTISVSNNAACSASDCQQLEVNKCYWILYPSTTSHSYDYCYVCLLFGSVQLVINVLLKEHGHARYYLYSDLTWPGSFYRHNTSRDSILKSRSYIFWNCLGWHRCCRSCSHFS